MSEYERLTTDYIIISESGTEIPQVDRATKRWNVERSNLLNIATICVKSLMDSSLSAGTARILTEDFTLLEQFFTILEHIVQHGLKIKRVLLGARKEFIAVLEALESKIPSLTDILTNMRNISTIKTNLGKVRTWMRLALMQKILAEQMLAMVEERATLREFYEEHSFMLSEEGAVIAGMLVGLNVIDCNFDLKGVDLDNHFNIIDISFYLRDGNFLNKVHEEKEEEDTTLPDHKFEMILDQKAYLEQMNKTLSDSLAELKQQVLEREESEPNSENEVEELRNRLVSIIAEKERYKKDYDALSVEHNNRLQTVNADMSVERETYEQSRTGLNDLYLEASKKLEEETQERKELDIMLEEQRAMNKEKEVAMQLLEKDIHDKQDTLISLRKQLEDVKKINLEMHEKWQTSDAALKKQTSEWAAMEQNCARMIAQTKEMEKKVALTDAQNKQAEKISHQLGAKLAAVQAEKCTMETDFKVEREWRVNLQSELDSERAKCGKLSKEVQKMNSLEKENLELRTSLEKSESMVREQETALMEMGHKVNKSTTQADELKEMQAMMKDNQWLHDKDAAECQSCEQAFSLARRKHHCRNCGGIFCNSCSDNTMPLPSSAKPVRVCDMCHGTLLERYSSGAS